ncbi:MAG TPA: hypothetical protein IAA29_00390, partial [Candidatus Paenibacillus intestinavium]|nr:hypothetical protein [Candidatus Paenibacillus intestinavium]
MQEWLRGLKDQTEIMKNVTEWRVIPPRDAFSVSLPIDLHPELYKALQSKGMTELYTHQRDAFEAANRGIDVV